MKLVLLAALAFTQPFVQAAEAPATRVAKQASEQGFRSCSGALDVLVKDVHKDDTAYGHLGTWSQSAPDGHLFDSTTVQQFSDTTMVAHFSAVRNQAGKCDISHAQVMAFGKSSCSTLRETAFKDWKYLQDLAGSAVYERPDNKANTVFLTPIEGGGCLVIKRYVEFGN